jgi:hypothetical protein
MLEMLVMSMVRLRPKKSCELEDYVVLSNENYEPVDKLSEMLRKAA